MASTPGGLAVAGKHCLILVGVFGSLTAIYFAALFISVGRVGFPLDDAYIHLQFARNLYESGQMAFNPGVLSGGSTAPLYPYLLAWTYRLVPDWELASIILGGVCGLAGVLAAYGLLRSSTRRSDIALWGGLICVVICPGIESAYSGMESAAYTLVFILGLWAYSSGRRLLGSLIFGAGIWLRPELGIMLGVILLERALEMRRCDPRRRFRIFAEIGAHLIVWSALIAMYMLYHWRLYGHLLPGTFAAKAIAPFAPKPLWLEGLFAAVRGGRWLHALLAVTLWPALILLLAGVGIWSVCPPLANRLRDAIFKSWHGSDAAAAGRRLAVLSLLAYPIFRGIVDPTGIFWYQQQRYFAHFSVLVVFLVLGSLVMAEGTEKSAIAQCRKLMRWAVVMQLLFLTVTFISVSNIENMQVAIGEWLQDNSKPNDLVATNDIGAIAFVSGQPVLDTVGLIEPDIVKHYLNRGTTLEYLQRRRPRFVAIFPGWYPEVANYLETSRVHSQRLELNVVCGGREMVVYEPNWETPK